MNKERRRRLIVLSGQLNEIQQEEQEAHDNMPLHMQDSDRGDAMDDNVTDIDECVSLIEGVIQR